MKVFSENYVPQKVKDYSFAIFVTYGGIWTVKKIVEIIGNYAARKKKLQLLEKWSEINSPKDVVILHTIPYRAETPHASPYVVKLETFLRMTNIPYQMDFENPWSQQGKTPWVSINGQHINDSQIIIEELARKFGKSLGNYNDKEKAIASAVRIMMDEHFSWGLRLWRYVYSEGQGMSEIFDMPSASLNAFYKNVHSRVKETSWAQGIGRHSQEEVVNFMKKDLEIASNILGSNKFLLGDEPTIDDCSLFGFLVEVLWCAPGSPYESFVQNEFVNLKEYTMRMKRIYFLQDWDECFAGASNKSSLGRQNDTHFD